MSESTGSAAAEPGVLAALLDRLTGGGLDGARLDWLGDESGRVASNLLVLTQRGWPEIAAVGSRLALFTVGGALLAGLAAAVVGWLLYMVAAGPLLRRGWRTGRLIGCCAATAVLLCAGTGGAWAGLWVGAGRVLEEAIEESYVVERLAAATFLAFTLDQDELPLDIGATEVEGLLNQAQRRSAASWESFRARAESAAGDRVEPPAWLGPELMVGVVEKLSGDMAPDLIALHGVLTASTERGAEALQKTAPIRRRSVELLRGTVYIQAATGLGFGLILPLVGLVLLGLLGVVVNRGERPRGPAGST